MLRELAGLRALARSLVHGDADADDLLQETAIAAISHSPDEDRPVRPWLATVLRNHWRMDRRSRSRRQAREQLAEAAAASVDETAADAIGETIDRARALERLAAALVALEEPLRTVVIRRYLDGQTAAEIARSLGVPGGTVRWRLKTGLERLRAALEKSDPRWQRALAPFVAKGAVLVKAKTAAISIALLVLLLAAVTIVFVKYRNGDQTTAPKQAVTRTAVIPKQQPGQILLHDSDGGVAVGEPLPGQGRGFIEPIAAPGGAISGRVINWSTGDGVAGAELTFTGMAGASTIRSDKNGTFELAPPVAGSFSLTAVVAAGFLPFAPELSHSRVNVELGPKQAVRGITLFLFPAIDYMGRVVDGGGSPVAGARVRLSGSPGHEQTLEKIETEWTTNKAGQFVFHAPDFAVFEASHGSKRGFAILDGDVATTKKMTITLGDGAARDATIRGKTVDASGAPIADVLVTAVPDEPPGKPAVPRALAYATTGAEGTFVLDGLDRGPYTLVAEEEGYAPIKRGDIAGGTQDVVLALDVGLALAGTVVTPDREPVPSYTLLVTRREGIMREMIVERAVVDPRGHFAVRVPKGDYELIAMAYGWAPSPAEKVSAGTTDARITVSGGATLQGVVVDNATGAPLQYARVSREGAGGGASVQVANAGTVTRADGTFELTGIPPGPFTISIGAGDYHPRLEAGLVATDGGILGPIKLTLRKLAEGEQPKIELVGIGVKLAGDGDTMRVDMVVPDSGAAAAGIVVGDRITAIDGVAVTTLGMDGAVSRIRGVAGTKLAVTLVRGGATVTLVVERKPLRF